MKPSPVAIFAYRRPGHLKRVVEALAEQPEAGSTALTLFLDGAKGAGDEREVEAVRKLAGGIKGFHAVHVQAAKANQGLARSITQGVGKMCREYGQVIVLEDDVIPAPGFLSFMNTALNKYQGEPRVMQISGYAYPLNPALASHVLLPLTSCWGWATWLRSWQKFHWDPVAAKKDLADPAFVRRFDLEGAYPYSCLLRDVVEGKSDSWGVIWYWLLFRENGLSLFPSQSLVKNIGWDGSGEHAVPSWTKSAPAPGHGTGAAWPGGIRANSEVLTAIGDMLKGKAGHSHSGRHGV